MALNFNKMAADGNLFINDLATWLGYSDDTARAGRVLRSFLHALRDQLTLEESFQLLAQLPMFLKAVYVDRWKPVSGKRRIKHPEAFFALMRNVDYPASSNDLPSDEEAERACIVMLMVLRKYISLGELEDIRSILPKELKPMFNNALMI